MKIETAIEIKNSLALRFDLPELTACRVALVDQAYASNAEVAPTGQIAGLVSSLGVTLNTDELPMTGSIAYRVRLRYAYQHPGGGSNGVTREMFAIVAQERRYGEPAEILLEIISEETYQKLYGNISSAVLKTERAQAKASAATMEAARERAEACAAAENKSKS